MLTHTGQWVSFVQPFVDFGEERHPIPSAEQQIRVRALVTAYGSKDVKALFASYHEVITKIITLDRAIGIAQRTANAQEPTLREQLERELRPKELELRDKIGYQVASELRAGDPQRRTSDTSHDTESAN